ncbi:MAG: ABC transporter substrate-binding protein [Acidobacteria bacterium]|nr:ABC transporter substrate-binding protein [Acidobacteriota bacterium]
MTPARTLRLAYTAVLTLVVVVFSQRCGTPQVAGDDWPVEGGRLVATFRTEPTNFNRLVDAGPVGRLSALLTQATLLRVDPTSGDLEPRLATAWTGTPDGLTWTFTLRPGLKFSDGEPFSSSDVLFTFQALYDERVGSQLGKEMQVGGLPLQVRALDDHHVVLTFPAPFGPGISILDSLPILPRHKLKAALDAGTFPAAWTASTDLSAIAGMGPFVLTEYLPAQRMLFVRNPHFWRTDEQGRTLPYLDELEVPIVPEQNAELLRMQAGQADLINSGARAEDLAMLRDAQTAGRLRLVEAGTSIDVSTFWFNLTPGAAATQQKPWLGDEIFRRALSHAINRQVIVDTVYLGAATPVYGPVTPGHGEWYVPDMGATPFDLGRARTLLTSIGLEDRDGDGVLEDTRQRPVRFSILTQRGNTDRERTSAVLQEQLRQVGIAVDVVALDVPALRGRFGSGDYEAMYYGASSNSKDPADNMGFWLSSGGFHFWNPGQSSPATAWEAALDALMQRQATTMDRADRRRLFAEAQQLLADHVPALWFAAPTITVPISARAGGATPAVISPPVLWNAEQLYITGTRR